MSHQESRVNGDLAVQRIEELTEGFPRPVDALLERDERHPLDLGHHSPSEVGIPTLEGCQREATIATDHARHTVPTRRCRQCVPVQLGVVVGVWVDKTGGDHVSADIDGSDGSLREVANRDNAPIADADVGAHPLGPRAVDDDAALQCDVQHVDPSGSWFVWVLAGGTLVPNQSFARYPPMSGL